MLCCSDREPFDEQDEQRQELAKAPQQDKDTADFNELLQQIDKADGKSNNQEHQTVRWHVVAARRDAAHWTLRAKTYPVCACSFTYSSRARARAAAWLLVQEHNWASEVFGAEATAEQQAEDPQTLRAELEVASANGVALTNEIEQLKAALTDSKRHAEHDKAALERERKAAAQQQEALDSARAELDVALDAARVELAAVQKAEMVLLQETEMLNAAVAKKHTVGQQRKALDEAGDQALHEPSAAKWKVEEGLRKSEQQQNDVAQRSQANEIEQLKAALTDAKRHAEHDRAELERERKAAAQQQEILDAARAELDVALDIARVELAAVQKIGMQAQANREGELFVEESAEQSAELAQRTQRDNENRAGVFAMKSPARPKSLFATSKERNREKEAREKEAREEEAREEEAREEEARAREKEMKEKDEVEYRVQRRQAAHALQLHHHELEDIILSLRQA